MSAESAYLFTFGAETETEAEIRSTSTQNVAGPGKTFPPSRPLSTGLTHKKAEACSRTES